MGFWNTLKKIGQGVGVVGGNVLASTGIPGLTGVGSGIAALSGASMQNDANMEMQQANIEAQNAINERNIQLARETNEFNRQSMQMQAQLQKQMFDYTNAYNDPSEQVKRSIAAGINPYADGGAQTVQAGLASQPSAPSSNAAVAPQLTAPKYDYVSNSFDSFAHGLVALADSANKRVQTDFDLATFAERVREAFSRADKMEADSLGAKIATNTAKMEYDLLSDTYQDRVQQFHADFLYRQEATREMMAKTAKENAETQWIHMQVQFKNAELGLKQQEIDAIMKSAILSYNVGMANVSAQNFATGVQAAEFDKAHALEVNKAKNAALHSLGQLKLDAKRMSIAKGQLELGFKQLEWDKSWSKVAHGFVEGLGGSLGTALGVYSSKKQAAKSVIDYKNRNNKRVVGTMSYKTKNGVHVKQYKYGSAKDYGH